MWQNFEVKNFRGFRDVRLDSLARINLIAGKNNTGKTALLEAIHLHSNPQNCQVPFKINNLRGTGTDKKFDFDVCSWLFFDKKASSGLETISQDERGVRRSLRAWIVDAVSATTQCPEAEKALFENDLQESMLRHLWSSGDPRLVLRSEMNGQESWSTGFRVPWAEGLLQGGNPFLCDDLSVFIGSAGRSPEEDARAFSQLEAANRQEEVLPSLRILDPRLKRLSLLLLADKPVIHGNIGLSRLVPMQFMGEGIRRLLSIVLAISTTQGGKVLIDEIENGLHYSVQVDVWKAIARAARDAKVQVFATTHSYECIQAAHKAFTDAGPDEMRFYRLDRINDAIEVVAYDAELLSYATEMNHEVR